MSNHYNLKTRSVVALPRSKKLREAGYHVRKAGDEGLAGTDGKAILNVTLSQYTHIFEGTDTHAVGNESVLVQIIATRDGEIMDVQIGSITGTVDGMTVTAEPEGEPYPYVLISADSTLMAKSGTICIPVTACDVTQMHYFSWALGLSGAPGDTGKDAYALELTNGSTSIACDPSGTILPDSTLPTCQATLKIGGAAVDGTIYSLAQSYAGVSIDSNSGQMSFDRSFTFASTTLEIMVLASINGETVASAVMSITKCRQGSAGAPGKDAYSSATITLYQRSPAAPILAPDDTNYTFATGLLAPSSGGSLNGWQRTMPPEPEDSPCWCIQASVASKDTRTSVQGGYMTEGGQWSAPSRITGAKGNPGTPGLPGAPGTPGTNGMNTAEISLYMRSMNGAPDTAPGWLIYAFATHTLSEEEEDAFNGWSQTIPTDNPSSPCYVIKTSAVSRDASISLRGGFVDEEDEEGHGSWTRPARLTGNNGLRGKVMRGINEFTTNGLPDGRGDGEDGYQGLDETLTSLIYYDVVYTEATQEIEGGDGEEELVRHYYYCKNGVNAHHYVPGETTGWENFWGKAVNFDFIATRVLLAQNAFIDILSGNGVYMYYDDGVHIAAGMQGGHGVNFFAGMPIGGTVADSPFKVLGDGTVYNAKNIASGYQRTEFAMLGSLSSLYSSADQSWHLDGAHSYLVSGNISKYRNLTPRVVLPAASAALNGLEYNIFVEPALTRSELAMYSGHLYISCQSGDTILDYTAISNRDAYQSGVTNVMAYQGFVKIICIPSDRTVSGYIWAIRESSIAVAHLDSSFNIVTTGDSAAYNKIQSNNVSQMRLSGNELIIE